LSVKNEQDPPLTSYWYFSGL